MFVGRCKKWPQDDNKQQNRDDDDNSLSKNCKGTLLPAHSVGLATATLRLRKLLFYAHGALPFWHGMAAAKPSCTIGLYPSSMAVQ